MTNLTIGADKIFWKSNLFDLNNSIIVNAKPNLEGCDAKFVEINTLKVNNVLL